MDTITTLLRSVYLPSDDLFTKFGFSDGDLLNDVLDDHYPDGVPNLPGDHLGFRHRVLVRVVREHLLPRCPSADVYEISTLHNPIRYEDSVSRFTEVEVWVPVDEVIRIAEDVARG